MFNGIYLTKIAVLGPDKQATSINFKTGLNVISGASNTGKSYVLQCIEYVFGAKDQPKDIFLAKGYKEIRAELHTSNGKVLTINREFGSGFVYLAESSFDNFVITATKKLSTTHGENDSNLSNYLLNILSLSGKKLKKNDKNETKNLSFRDLAKFCIVSEDRISNETSPIYSGQYYEKTENKSLFKLLLTGQDDDDLELIEDQAIAKNKIKGKIDFINERLVEKEKSLSEIKSKVDALASDAINVKIEELMKLVNNAQKEIFAEEQKRQGIWEELGNIRAQLNQTLELKKRFSLLNEHYTSDLNRLDFLNEGKQYIDQLEKINCPICDNLIEQKLLEPYEDDHSIINSVKTEFQKIKGKQIELIRTIETLDKNKLELEDKHKDKELEFEKINKHISDKLKPIHQANYINLQTFLKLRDEKAQVVLIEEDIKRAKDDLRYYKEKLNEKQEKAPEIVLPEQIYTDFSNEVRSILLEWGVSCSHVRYNPDISDIEIDGEKRRNMGKGYRAIYLSAFMLAAMFFCIKKKLKHPFFLVLDSPLTAYKERDHSTDPVDQIPESIQNKFYQSLARLENIDKVQIIVIDNKDPPEDIRDKINYVHFSKNANQGRYGFYPVDNGS